VNKRFSSIKRAATCIIALFLLMSWSRFVFPSRTSIPPGNKRDVSKILKEIYKEIKEFSKYPGCDFIKREFFVGDDDDDTNKDTHIVIIVQDVNEKEKVTIQVTYMERSKGKPVIGIAKYVKALSYFIQENHIEIIKSDFDDKEKDYILPGILRAIKNKKKLLKEIESEKRD
jgi:hypothetical protein